MLCLLAVGIAGCTPSAEQAIKAPDPVSFKPTIENAASTYAQPANGQPAESGSNAPTKSPDPKEPAEKPSKLFTWASTREDGLRIAKKNNGIVVLKFEAEWCGPCQVMKHEAFNDPVVAKSLRHAVIVPIDLDTEIGQQLAPQYEVESIPRLVFLKADGKPFGKIDGYMTLDGFRRDVDRILKG
jgi:thiol:disulfide interchange protein